MPPDREGIIDPQDIKWGGLQPQERQGSINDMEYLQEELKVFKVEEQYPRGIASPESSSRSKEKGDRVITG